MKYKKVYQHHLCNANILYTIFSKKSSVFEDFVCFFISSSVKRESWRMVFLYFFMLHLLFKFSILSYLHNGCQIIEKLQGTPRSCRYSCRSSRTRSGHSQRARGYCWQKKAKPATNSCVLLS